MTRLVSFAALVVLLAGCGPTAAGSAWVRAFGGANDDNCSSVQQTRDSGYVLTGTTWSYGEGQDDVYLVRTNQDGDTLWTRPFGGIAYDNGDAGVQAADGGFVLVGGTSSFGDREQVYLVKVDANGAQVWNQALGSADENEYGTSLGLTTDGGYIIAGWTSADSGGVLLLRTDGLGNPVWSQVKGSADKNEYGAAVAPTADGGFVIVGTTYQYDPNGDVWLARTDGAGNDVWEPRHFGGAATDLGESVQPTSDGGYIIAGVTHSFGSGSADVYLIKTDAAGNEVWSRTFGGSSNDGGSAAAQTTDGGYIIAGFTRSFGAGGSDVYLVKTDANGAEVWHNTFGGSADDEGLSVRPTTDGGYVIGGSTKSLGHGGSDAYLIKTDGRGE